MKKEDTGIVKVAKYADIGMGLAALLAAVYCYLVLNNMSFVLISLFMSAFSFSMAIVKPSKVVQSLMNKKMIRKVDHTKG